MLQDPEQISAFVETLQNMPTLLLSVGTFVILVLTLSASRFNDVTMRFAYLFALATAMIIFARELNDINGEYFLNVGTELLGALLVIIVLSDLTASRQLLLPVIMLVIMLTTIPVGLVSDPVDQSFVANLSTELVGAFVIFVLLQRRDWLWNNQRERRESRKILRAKQLHRMKTRKVAEIRVREKALLERAIAADLKQWHFGDEACDCGMRITAWTMDELKQKVRWLKKRVEIIHISNPTRDEETDAVECYVLVVLPKFHVHEALQPAEEPATATRS